jgi:hypothetical protein
MPAAHFFLHCAGVQEASLIGAKWRHTEDAFPGEVDVQTVSYF